MSAERPVAFGAGAARAAPCRRLKAPGVSSVRVAIDPVRQRAQFNQAAIEHAAGTPVESDCTGPEYVEGQHRCVYESSRFILEDVQRLATAWNRVLPCLAW